MRSAGFLRFVIVLPPVLLAAVLFACHLASSSLFVDEARTWAVSRPPASGLLDRVANVELSPPGHYAAEAIWLRLGPDRAEWWLRLPSLVARVLLVAAVAWLAWRLANRRAALVAATLTAISPLVLRYAQQARGYVWAMLALAIAVASALGGAERARRGRSSVRWLALSLVASLCALGLHYTAVLVVAPLCVWLMTRPELDRESVSATSWHARWFGCPS